jgi:hypothetical protein
MNKIRDEKNKCIGDKRGYYSRYQRKPKDY